MYLLYLLITFIPLDIKLEGGAEVVTYYVPNNTARQLFMQQNCKKLQEKFPIVIYPATDISTQFFVAIIIVRSRRQLLFEL